MEPFEYQFRKILTSFNEGTKEESALFKKQLSELKNKKANLEERFAFGKINGELYMKFSVKVDEEIRSLIERNEIPEIDISNLKKKLKSAVEFSQNISKNWTLGSLDTKHGIQKLVFPEGIVLDTKNRQYLTTKVNLLFSTIPDFIDSSEGLKKNSPSKMMGSPS